MDFWRHLKTVQRHRRLVRQHCFRLGLYWQGLTHDLSKFSPVEFWAGVKYFQGDRSPNDAQRRDKGYSASWMHHKGRNRHHFEYWTDYGVSGEGIIGVEMPKKYVAEMFCDRLAASKVYRGQDFPAGRPLPVFPVWQKEAAAHASGHLGTAGDHPDRPPGSGRGRRLRLCAAGGLGEEVGFFIPELCELPKSVALVTTLSLVT